MNAWHWSVVGVFVLFVAACEDQGQQKPTQQKPPQVTVATPVKQNVTEWDEYTGRFQAVESVDVRARVSGFVAAIHFTDGQMVEKGDLLFIIDQRPFKIAVGQAEAELARARATFDLANLEFDRAIPLAKKNVIAKGQLDIRQTTVQQAAAGVDAAKSAVDQAKLNLNWSAVRALISGRTSDARIDVGNLVTGGQDNATVLTTIVSLDPIHFIFEASEADLLKYTRLARKGTRPSLRETANPVRVKLADEKDFVHEGRMDFVDNQIDPRSGTIRGRAVFANPDQLLQPGLFGRMQLLGRTAETLLIPDDAIASNQAKRIVFAVSDDGTVTAKTITLGPIVKGLRVVRSGLEEGDQIVISGLQRARPGQKVTPEKGEIKAPSGTAN